MSVPSAPIRSRVCGSTSPRGLNWGLKYKLKQRWGVSVASILRRAFDLGMISEATYRRGFMHLNQTGQRKREKFEPPIEEATLLRDAMRLVFEDRPEHALATEIGVHSLGDIVGGS